MEWILHLGIILLAAKAGAELFQRLGMSAVVGEIFAGIIIGHSVLNLVPGDDHLSGELIKHLAELGVLFMIFLLGLETKVAHILEVGVTALLIAIGGILAPLALGYGLGIFLGFDWKISLFIGTVLTATSVAISTRVFLDCGMGRSRITRTIVAAAVIDDIVGLIVLTIVLALTGAGMSGGHIGIMLGKQALLLFIGFPIAFWIIPRLLTWVRKIEGEGAMFTVILGSTLLFAYGGVPSGMEPIIGAFLVGVIFGSTPEAVSVERQVTSLVHFLAPVFFVHVGLMMDLGALKEISGIQTGLGFAMVLTVVATISKLVGAFAGGAIRRLPVVENLLIGVGMVPRGEVGLIVAGIGLKAGILDDNMYSAVALMCVLTIIIVPPLLKPLVKIMKNKTTEAAAAEEDTGHE